MATKPVRVTPKPSKIWALAAHLAVVARVVNALRRIAAASIRRAGLVEIPAKPSIFAGLGLAFARIELHALAGHARGGRARVRGNHAIGVRGARRPEARVGVEGHALAKGIGFSAAASAAASSPVEASASAASAEARINDWIGSFDRAARNKRSDHEKDSVQHQPTVLIFFAIGASRICAFKSALASFRSVTHSAVLVGVEAEIAFVTSVF